MYICTVSITITNVILTNQSANNYMLKTSKKIILTPREEKKALKTDFLERTAALKKVLPHNWKLLFMHDFKEYKDQTALLTNVISCRSLHLDTLIKIEKWSKTLNK